ncbi:hypothetical protein HDU93_006054 [Gonapodya sp. JEL0774]|nr:hypothetical protein HDU93_006054 [Gonapodya sp. JEL0774]
MDNASNNDTLMRAIATVAGVHEDFDPVESRLRCFAHILHLAARAGMDALRLPDVDEDMEVEDGDGNVLKKVYALIFRVRRSPQLRALYADQFLDAAMARELIAPVGTRWRSDFDAINRFLQDRTAVEKLLASDRSLGKYRLTDNEWGHLERLCRLLQPLALALTQMESVCFPTLFLVIPLFNMLMDKLEDADFTEEPVLAGVRDAIMEVLRKYYGKSDDSRMYMLCLGECASSLA